MTERAYFVYILANESRPIYTGVTNDLARRVEEHRAAIVPGFSARYDLKKLVYYERLESAYAALVREKQIKAWTRAKRLALIAGINPEWDDLSGTL